MLTHSTVFLQNPGIWGKFTLQADLYKLPPALLEAVLARNKAWRSNLCLWFENAALCAPFLFACGHALCSECEGHSSLPAPGPSSVRELSERWSLYNGAPGDKPCVVSSTTDQVDGQSPFGNVRATHPLHPQQSSTGAVGQTTSAAGRLSQRKTCAPAYGGLGATQALACNSEAASASER